MNIRQDQRTVMTLDAGGTKFSFSAVRAATEIIEPIILSARGDLLEDILNTIIEGFRKVESRLDEKAVAISFCFPGPADYENGIIGDLENLPAFKGGVALKDMLEEHFHIPVFINNDGDLFAYGEAIAGILPDINRKIKKAGIDKQYGNLLGVTFGTGFGGGIVSNEKLFFGDNSASGEINRSRNKLYPEMTVEESVSIRGVQRVYCREAGLDFANAPDTKTIFEIGTGKHAGSKAAAIKAFEELAVVAGDTIANASTLVDGLVVIGGGLSGAHPLFLQKIVDEMNNDFRTPNGKIVHRMEIRAFNLEDPNGLKEFLKDEQSMIKVPFSDKQVRYNPAKKIGVGLSRQGTSKAVSIGAYAFALNKLDA